MRFTRSYLPFTSGRAIALTAVFACAWAGCGEAGERSAAAAAGTSAAGGIPSGKGGNAAESGGPAGESGGAGGSAPMLGGYERLTKTAVDFARNICRCLGGLEGAALEDCARADAREYAGLRIDSLDSTRCFEQELASAFPDAIECATIHLESMRDCSTKLPFGPSCDLRLGACPPSSSCSSLPDYVAYRKRSEHCAQVLYCASGQETVGWRCDEQFDCVDRSDEADCE